MLERELRPRIVDYTPFVTIAEDTDQTIAQERATLLQEARLDLSREIHERTSFHTGLDRILSHLHEALPNSNQQEAIHSWIPGLINDCLGTVNSDETRQELRLDEVAEVFYQLGQLTTPLYGNFAKELDDFADENNLTHKRSYLFCGRDSFPFLLASRRTQEIKGSDTIPAEIHYAPFNRLGFQRLFSGSDGEKAFKHDLTEFYHKQNLTDHDVVAIDFGFIGSLERISQIVLDKEDQPSSLHHFLFTTFRKVKPPWFLDNLAVMGYSVDEDHTYVENNIQGYLNRIIDKYPEDTELTAIYNNGTTDAAEWKPYLNPFMLFLQEMGAGVNESRQDCLNTGDEKAYKGTHLKFASIQQMVGLVSYLRGIHHALQERTTIYDDTEGITSLKDTFNLFADHTDFFQEYIPQEDRRHLTGIVASPIFERVTNDIAKLRTLPISTVKFPQSKR